MQVVRNYQQNNPAFKMNLTCKQGSGTRDIIKKGWEKFYYDCYPVAREKHFGENEFNFNQMYKNLQKCFR